MSEQVKFFGPMGEMDLFSMNTTFGFMHSLRSFMIRKQY